MIVVQMSKTRRERILAVTDDLVTDFLYYDRKECSYLPMNEIEEAILNNEITIEERKSLQYIYLQYKDRAYYK